MGLGGVIVGLLAVLMGCDSVLLGMLMVAMGVLESRGMVVMRGSGMVGRGGQMTLVGSMLGGGHGMDPFSDDCRLGDDFATDAEQTPAAPQARHDRLMTQG